MVEMVTFGSPIGVPFSNINFWSLVMKKMLMGLGLVLVLAACGTNVPLTDVPVSDATAKPVTGPSTPASTGSVNGSKVAPVTLTDVSSPDKAVLAGRVVYFDYDSFVVKPEFQSLIAEHARYIKAQSGRKVAIEGHTDETGGREYNLALGQKRADAVRNALGLLGVSQVQMESVSFGKEKPAMAGSSDEAYAKNRRTEIRYP
jgi:peptidoglycan-associated lipoprotein